MMEALLTMLVIGAVTVNVGAAIGWLRRRWR